jgi:REP element-mobilizing transposase RayT
LLIVRINAMTYARKSLVSLRETPYYHVVARCVRRAWLWGFDEYAGKDYSHRKAWVLERMAQLEPVFAIDLCAYAVMSNHYHLVLHVDASRAAGWSEREVIRRWRRLFRLPVLVQRYLDESGCSIAEREEAQRLIARWRERLSNVSWYMRCLNESLARRANAEDDCTGRFWEGRFKSQALLDDAGLLTAMAYVDLNPVRAGVAKTPESSDDTSIYERVRTHHAAQSETRATGARAPVRLLPLRPTPSRTSPHLPFRFEDYLTLLQWTGRALHCEKRGCVAQAKPPILTRLSIDAAAWESAMQPHGNRFGRALGRLDNLRIHAHAIGQQWIRGLRHCERLYHPAA